MGELFAAIVGIQKYQDPFLKPVLFAEADARAVSVALEALGCGPGNQRVLINEAATKTAIESDFADLLSLLASDDQCFVFFAGHGFSDGSFNYLAAHDTRSRRIEETSVRLQRLLGLIKGCRSKKIVLFLDACHTGIQVEETMRSSVRGIDVDAVQFCAGFASCRAEEKSYSSTRLKQGIWTHHLLEALRGEATKALDGEMITAAKLQEHLAAEVPRTLRLDFATPPSQTPRFFGSFEGIAAIADLAPVLLKKRADAASKALKLDRVTLVRRAGVKISSLKGFNKKRGHFVPDNVSNRVDRFVHEAATEELQAHMDAIYEKLRAKMKVKIKDIQTPEARDGSATIRVPAFDYNVSVGQDPSEPTMALWRYELVNVRDPMIIQDPNFNDVFSNSFDRVELVFAGDPPNIRDLASNLEDAGFDVDCPRDFSSCSFVPSADGPTVSISEMSIEFVFPRRLPPQQLTAGFRTSLGALSGQTVLTKLLQS